MPNTPIAKSMLDLLSHINLPAVGHPVPGADHALTDPAVPLTGAVEPAYAVLDGLLAEVEQDLHEARNHAAGTALGLAGTRLSLDRSRGAKPPQHVEWLAAHLRTAATELSAGQAGKALKAVRLARLALRT